MPGLAGAMCRERPDAMDAATRLGGAMLRGRLRRTSEFCSSDGRTAAVQIDLLPAPRRVADWAGAFRVLLHGRVDNLAEFGASESEANGDDQARVLETLLEERGAAVLRRLRGQFSLAAFDRSTNTLMLVSDPLGSHPVYWSVDSDRLLFAGSVAGLAAVSGRKSLDPRAVADFLHFGFVTGTATLADGVQVLQPGSILTCSLPDLRPGLTRHFEVASLFTKGNAGKDDYTQAVTAAFVEAAGRAVADVTSAGLSLSGGLDSRAVLSATPAGVSLTTCTLGRRGCADHVIANKLARRAGTNHKFFELDQRYLKDFLPNMRAMVALTDGLYLSHGLTEMLALQFLEACDFRVLLRGHGGELLKLSLAWPLHTDERVRAMATPDGFVPYLFDRVNYITRGVDLNALFTPAWSKCLVGQARRSLEQVLGGVDLPGADLCAYLYLNEHHRRFTLPSLEVFRTLFDVRMPFVDVRFLAQLFSGPAAWRDGTELHRAIVARAAPRLLGVRNSNTGVSAGASPLVETLFDKPNTALKRLGVYGFRHYHDFDGWMRQMLLESVESVLMAPRCLDRGMLQRETLHTLIDDTRSGRADHGYLFQVLLILELWQQSLEA